MRSLLVVCCLLNGILTFSQEDSTIVLTYDEFISIVREHHPLSYQAQLQGEKGDAVVLKARGGFDPKLDGNANQKYYKDEQYYSYVHGGLKVPTWFGLTAQSGYEINEGTYLNPSARVPDDGLWYAGLSLTLGKGLLIDERRAELKQAKIYRESAEMEQRMMFNQLLFDASVAYWDWYVSYHKTAVYDDALRNARERFEGIKQSAFLGDRPFIDTLESGILVQNREITLNQLQLDYRNKTAKLSLFLWQDGFVPLELSETTTPPSTDAFQAASFESGSLDAIDSLLLNHPKLVIYQNKLESKSIDLRLKKQELLPQIDLKYNLISEPIGSNVLSEVNPSDYNWGLQFSYPILSRKERGSARLTSIEVEQMQMDTYFIEQEIEYKVKMAQNILITSAELVEQFEQITMDYAALFDAENKLFTIGESSLFLLNSRESVLLDAQLKFLEYQRNNQIARTELDYQLVRLTR